MTEAELESFGDGVGFGATIIAMMTVGGIVSGILALLKVRFCNMCCGGCWPKFWICFTFLGYVLLMVLFFLVGSALSVIKSGFNAEFIET